MHPRRHEDLHAYRHPLHTLAIGKEPIKWPTDRTARARRTPRPRSLRVLRLCLAACPGAGPGTRSRLCYHPSIPIYEIFKPSAGRFWSVRLFCEPGVGNFVKRERKQPHDRPKKPKCCAPGKGSSEVSKDPPCFWTKARRPRLNSLPGVKPQNTRLASKGASPSSPGTCSAPVPRPAFEACATRA
jgi:hypothetical protein